MSKLEGFTIKKYKIETGFFKGQEQKMIQCPVCSEWFHYYYDTDLRGVKLHIRKWAGKESMAVALGETKRMPHLIFWRDNTRLVKAVPQAREWNI